MEVTSRARCSTISERLDQIRLRIRLERISAIPVTSKEEFLEFCRQYERREEELSCGGETEWDISLTARQEGPIHWNPFGDWNNYAPDHYLQTCIHSLL